MGAPFSNLLPGGMQPRTAEHRRHLAEELCKAEARRCIRRANQCRFMVLDPAGAPLCIQISRREARRLVACFGELLVVELSGTWFRLCTLCLSPF